MTFLQTMLAEASKPKDESAIPYKAMEKIKKLVKNGAMDPDATWSSAAELVHAAFATEHVSLPTPGMKAAWDQYVQTLTFAVQQLQKATDKGVRDDGWKLLSSKLEDQMAGGNSGGFRKKFGI